MKKTLILFSAVLAFAACNKVEPAVDVNSPEAPVTFNVTVGSSDDTKAVKSAWANGDKINVFFEGLAEKWLVLTNDGSAWNAAPGAEGFVAGDFAALGTKELTAVHVPVDATVTYASSKFSFTDAAGNPIYTYYLYESNKAYTVSGATVTVALSLQKPANFVWFHVAGIEANADQYYLKEAHLTATACDYVALAGGVTEKETAGHVLTPVADADGAMYAAKGTALGASTTYNFQLVKVNAASNMYAEGTYTRTVAGKSLTTGKQVNLTTPLSGTEWTFNKWVDLGFATNNVAWAVGNLTNFTAGGYNIGNVSNLGSAFYWGGTTGYSRSGGVWGHNFALETAPYRNTENDGYTKYNTTDNKTVLEAVDDAANVILGDGWRIPTLEEAQNIVNACTNMQVNDYPDSPVAGYRVEGPSGVAMFFRATGYATGTESTNQSYVYFWTSKLRDNTVSSHGVRLNSSSEVSSFTRYRGLVIRPVKAL